MNSFRVHMRKTAEAFLRTALTRADGSVRRMARETGINRTHLHQMLLNYKIRTTRPRNRGNAAWRQLGEKS